MRNILFLHGAWHGSWCWEKIPLSFNSYYLETPTLPGLDFTKKLDSRNINLDTHIKFVEEIISKKDSWIIIAHSYSGMILTDLLINHSNKIEKAIYLDAFLPDPNQSLFDISEPSKVQIFLNSLVDENGKKNNPYLLPPLPMKALGILDEKLILEIKPKLVPMPIKCFDNKISFGNISNMVEKHFIRCLKCPIFEKFETKAKKNGFEMHTINEGHDLMITSPDELIKLLYKII